MANTNKPPKAALLNAGKAARERAMFTAGSSRINADAWFPELMEFKNRGWPDVWIAEALQMTDRQVRKILADGRQHRADLLQAPIFTGKLSAEAAAMLEFTPAGFKLFFEEHSGHELQPFQWEWIEGFTQDRRTMLNVPPRHGKSTILSVWVPIWLLCMDRDQQILMVSKTVQLARKFCRNVEVQLSSNEKLIRTFGRFAPDHVGDWPWRPESGELLVAGRSRDIRSGDLSIQSRGMTQQFLGSEATVIVMDDITDHSLATSPTSHEEEMRKFREEIMSRMETPKTRGHLTGRAVIIGQRVALYDLYAEVAETTYRRGERKGESIWRVHTQKTVLDWEKQEVLWPEKYDWEEIEILYGDLGEASFEMMHQQNPRPEGSQMIRPEWLEGCRDLDRTLGEGVRGKPGILPTARVMSIDPSPTMMNSACIADVTSFRGGWGMVVLEDRWWKGKGDAFKREVERAINLYQIDYLIIEESSFFGWFTEDPWFEALERRGMLIHHKTNVNKNDLERGADSLAADYEMGVIRTPFGDEESRERTLRAEGEALDWGMNPKFFDNHMARWFIKWNRKKLRAAMEFQSHFNGVITPRLNATGRRWEAAKDRRRNWRDVTPT